MIFVGITKQTRKNLAILEILIENNIWNMPYFIQSPLAFEAGDVVAIYPDDHIPNLGEEEVGPLSNGKTVFMFVQVDGGVDYWKYLLESEYDEFGEFGNKTLLRKYKIDFNNLPETMEKILP